jgi:mono/diheme cytochrome c family protein
MNTSQFVLVVPFALLAFSSVFAAPTADTRALERGRYLVRISGCNDCHTAGYPESGGKIPQDQWLTGSAVGWSGPWGTTYPANLRLLVQSLSESQWLSFARTPRRPPMPWFALRDMSDTDLRAIYQFLRHLGPKGEPAPAYVPPGQVVSTPYIEFVPKNLPKHTAQAPKQ